MFFMFQSAQDIEEVNAFVANFFKKSYNYIKQKLS